MDMIARNTKFTITAQHGIDDGLPSFSGAFSRSFKHRYDVYQQVPPRSEGGIENRGVRDRCALYQERHQKFWLRPIWVTSDRSCAELSLLAAAEMSMIRSGLHETAMASN